MKATFAVLCCLVLAISAQSFEGTWTDSEYGGNIYICVDDSTMYMAFSQYGIGSGTVTNDGSRVSGTFYTAGGGHLDRETSGTFEWELDNDGNSFSGTYVFDGDNDGKYLSNLSSCSSFY